MCYTLYKRKQIVPIKHETIIKNEGGMNCMNEQIITMLYEIQATLGHMNERFDRIEERLDKMDARFDKIEERLDKIEERLDKIEERLDKIEERLDKIEVRLDKVEERLDKIEVRLDLVDTQLGEHSRLLRALVHASELHSAELAKINFNIAVIEGRLTHVEENIVTIKDTVISLDHRVAVLEDMSKNKRMHDDIGLLVRITARNWTDISELKEEKISKETAALKELLELKTAN